MVKKCCSNVCKKKKRNTKTKMYLKLVFKALFYKQSFLSYFPPIIVHQICVIVWYCPLIWKIPYILYTTKTSIYSPHYSKSLCHHYKWHSVLSLSFYTSPIHVMFSWKHTDPTGNISSNVNCFIIHIWFFILSCIP